MSYFLEDTNFGSMSDTVVVDYSGMNEAMFNAEVAWGAINESAMKTEYQAIKNEDASMLQEGISDFFEKVKEWFKNMISTISRVLSNIKNKILLRINYYEKFAIKAAEKVRAAKNNITKIKDDEKVKMNKFADYPRLVAIIGKSFSSDRKYKASNPLNKSDSEEAFKNLQSRYLTLQKIIKRGSDKTDYNLKDGINWVKDTVKLIKDDTKEIRDAQSSFDDAIKACKDGIKYSDSKDKEKVSNLKCTVTYLNRCSSMRLNLSMKVMSMVISDIKAVLAKIGGPKTDADKEFDKKYDNAMKKMNASYEGF